MASARRGVEVRRGSCGAGASIWCGRGGARGRRGPQRVRVGLWLAGPGEASGWDPCRRRQRRGLVRPIHRFVFSPSWYSCQRRTPPRPVPSRGMIPCLTSPPLPDPDRSQRRQPAPRMADVADDKAWTMDMNDLPCCRRQCCGTVASATKPRKQTHSTASQSPTTRSAAQTPDMLQNQFTVKKKALL